MKNISTLILVLILFTYPKNSLPNTFSWNEVSSGIEVLEFGVIKNNVEISFFAARLSPNDFDFKVIDIKGTLVGNNRNSETRHFTKEVKIGERTYIQYFRFSLDEVIEKINPDAIINGGFSRSLRYPSPAGLMISDSQEISTVTDSKGGILCFQKGLPSILSVDTYKKFYHEKTKMKCENALQSNPILFMQGDPGIFENELNLPAYPRSLVGIDKNNNLILIRTSKANLFHISQILEKGKFSKLLALKAVLSLSVHEESGLYIGGAIPKRIGNFRALLPSAIAAFSKP